jgi:hypothetical protein
VKRRTFLGAVAGLGAAAVTGACGVPSDSDPIRLGDAPTQGPPDINLLGQPYTPQDARNQLDLVRYFLSAAAGANTTGGDRPDALVQAQNRLKDFFTETGRATWQPGDKVLVVNVTLSGPNFSGGGFEIVATCVPLGYLSDRGDVSLESAALDTFTVTFTVVSFSGNQFRIDGVTRSSVAPLDLLLTDTALDGGDGGDGGYLPYPTYFWDADADTLVPELRYMPKAISYAKRSAEVVRWLTAGPSTWLQAQLQALPQEVEIKDTSWDTTSLRLVLNLSSKAANLDRNVLRKLAIQVQWSMRQGTVEVHIEGTPTGVVVDGDTAMPYNSAARPDDVGLTPEKYCVVDFRVRGTEGQTMTLLTSSSNDGVVLAGITRNKRYAAVVRKEVHGLRLWIGVVTGNGDAQSVAYVATDVVGTQFSRPVWLNRPSRMVMVVVDNRLVTVAPPVITPTGTSQPPSQPVTPLPRGLPSQITAFSVAPEGRRIALIADGQVIVAPMIFGDTVGIGDYRTVYTMLGSKVAVGWAQETQLVVGGTPPPGEPTNPTSGPPSLMQLPITGAVQEMLASKSFPVSRVSSYPANAIGNSRPFIMIESGGDAYDVFVQTLQPVVLRSGPTPNPSPSASATAPPPKISAPFFLD